VRPVLLEPILMSIAFEHYKQLTKLKDNMVHADLTKE